MVMALPPAQSADLVLAEPEFIERLSDCGIYPTGFFAVPGTQTCIRFSGYVRSHYAKTKIRARDSSTFANFTAASAAARATVTGDDDFSALDAASYTFWGQRGSAAV